MTSYDCSANILTDSVELDELEKALK